ncbi:MAG TPA: carboxypeptidase regulatory-like domain-containing protein [Vicinamibacterales bacterium]|nr:carboxypeptidase regulatory-like domain-containing protein [Vicinamibacterales bacterium]
MKRQPLVSGAVISLVAAPRLLIYRAALLLACATVAIVRPAVAQSTAARVSGIVYDEQRGVLPGADITLRNVDTGQVRNTVSDQTGGFVLIGLVPDRYELRIELSGFAVLTRPIDLTVGEDVELKPTLAIATLVQSVEVRADASTIEPSQTDLRRTITAKQIDELPVPNRDFTNLALLAPGILTNQVAAGSSTGIATAAQTGRDNNYVVDGLTLNNTNFSSTRGGISLDAIQEFVVLSNNFDAEYGQASGVVLNVVTKSGTNRRAGRVYYYHRDDRWDATSHAARLVGLEKSTFEQKVAGGSLGGPIVRNRAFYFGSFEDTMVDTQAIVTSAVLHDFRPDATAHVPVQNRTAQLLGRSDLTLSPPSVLTVRYRLEQPTMNNFFGAADIGKGAPERGLDVTGRKYDLAVLHNFANGPSSLNEFRFQFARSYFDRVSKVCPGGRPLPPLIGCWDEQRPGITLGKLSNAPSGTTENRWQFADSFTFLPPPAIGQHSLKAGVDISTIGLDSRGVTDGDGTFTFQGKASNLPFDPANPATYPTQYTQTLGNPTSHLDHTLYAAFVQDRWKPRANMTVNVGLRWDYDHAPGVSKETRDIAPRLGIAFDPTGRGTTSIRGGLGRYYDQVPLAVASLAEQAKTSHQILITNPGYPDPSSPNPNGNLPGPPNTTRLVDMRVPYTDQFTIGVQRALTSQLAVTADVVQGRGRYLLVTHDLNYPDLNAPNLPKPRPDLSYQRVTTVESRGNSWYRGLQIGLEKRPSRHYSYSLAYTLSRSERDTEDYTFVPQDQRDFSAERGPAANDARHRLSAALNLDLPGGLRLTAVITAQSALPYTITTGSDDNHDTFNNDRPAGVGRNSARGADFRQMDARMSKSFGEGAKRVEVLAEAFNLTNRANWTAYDGRKISPTFSRPTAALPARQIQVGVRFDF